MNELDPKSFIITRKRKKYRFALFHNNPLCSEVDEWPPGDSPNVLELGAGTGLFGVELARASPDHQFVAVDVKADRLQTGAKAATQAGLSNVRFLRARADQLLDIFAPHSIDAIWLTFPDPFPKDRMAKHRLTHPNFLKCYMTLLKPGGAVYFKTDAVKLFDWSLEQFDEQGWRLDELTFDLHGSNLSDGYKHQTTYEKRYMNEGLKINFVRAVPPTYQN